GEVMAIGRSFEEVLQKALRMLAIGADGFTANRNGRFRVKEYLDEIKHPTTDRIFAIAEAMRRGVTPEKIHGLSKIDPWFLAKMANIVAFERKAKRARLTPALIREAKRLGFSDKQVGTIRGKDEMTIRKMRLKAGIRPSVKQIDTLAGEFPAQTNYLYMTYHGDEHDLAPGKKSVVVLGSGPYSIGSSVEFDWSSVQALSTLRAAKRETVMVNCNPETVSTDYDMSDRLYFDELSFERVLDIIEFEKPGGVVVSTGGQVPNNLALPLHKHGVKILGTSPVDIDRAENRHSFSGLMDRLGIDQPPWEELTTAAAAERAAEKFGYPVLIRPSYILSGSAMNVVADPAALKKYLARAVMVSPEHPIVISKFIENAREIEIDGVATRGELTIYAITEHVENAGTHSGDATIVIPPQRTYFETIRRAKEITKAAAKELKITGPFNIQFLAKENRLQVIELNLRASRSFPFVSKATGHNFIRIALEAMLGKRTKTKYRTLDLDMVAVKSPQFSYGRIKDADPLLSVEMASTGEVASFGDSYDEALLKSMLSAGFRLPSKHILVSLGGEENKTKLLPSIRALHGLGFRFFATKNTAIFLKENGINATVVHKVSEGGEPNAASVIEKGEVGLILNITARRAVRSAKDGRAATDGYAIRRKAVDFGIPLITNRQLAEAFVNAFTAHKNGFLKADRK
ncbi:MAG: carbamoyl-phosphate synthase large subunit, partial [Patescibacteria group bacterium]